MMKLTKNETFVLKLLVGDPSSTNQDISETLDITPQGVGKIREIQKQELRIRANIQSIRFQFIGNAQKRLGQMQGLMQVGGISIHLAVYQNRGRENTDRVKSGVRKLAGPQPFIRPGLDDELF